MTTGGSSWPGPHASRGAGDESTDEGSRSGPGGPADGGPPMAPGQVPGAPVAPREQALPYVANNPAPTPAPAPAATPVPGAASPPGRTATAATATAARPAATVGPAPRRGGRRARLTLKRIDPWSTLKFSFVYSLAGLVVLLVAVIALYAIVDAMGVIDSIRGFLHDVEGESSDNGIASWLGFGRVMTVALVVGAVNVILFTAFATLSAFVYNVCTDLVGGIEVTLADRN